MGDGEAQVKAGGGAGRGKEPFIIFAPCTGLWHKAEVGRRHRGGVVGMFAPPGLPLAAGPPAQLLGGSHLVWSFPAPAQGHA